MSSRQPDAESEQAKSKTSPRAARLAEALRANLQKRKAQLRARRGGAEDARKDGMPVADSKDKA
jgi:hypothetical protein